MRTVCLTNLSFLFSEIFSVRQNVKGMPLIFCRAKCEENAATLGFRFRIINFPLIMRCRKLISQKNATKASRFEGRR